MHSLDMNDTAFAGRTSRPGASIGKHDPNCTRCGTSLRGQLDDVERFLDKATGTRATIWRWRCRCGRVRTLRRLEVVS
jgi:hypothetical protein